MQSRSQFALKTALAWSAPLDEVGNGLRQLQDGSAASTAELAKREKCTLRQLNLTISLALLSPRLVEAAVAGRLPRGIGITSLRNLPPEWAQQHKLLGLSF